jgi:hypothetical protein
LTVRLRIYSLILLATLAIGCLLYLPGQLILLRAGETLSIDEIISLQQQDDGLYFGLAEAPGNYKLAVYARRKPDIVILGSSRAHRQRQEFYRLPSYTVSGIVYSPTDAIETMDLLIPVHKPKYVIYNLDYFAFCTRDPRVAAQTRFSRPRGRPNTGWAWGASNRFRLIPDLVRTGRLKPGQVADLALGRFASAPNGVSLIGMSALMDRRGFRLDGSLSSVDSRQQDVVQMQEARREPVDGTWHFEGGCHFDPQAMAHLQMLQDEMTQQGIRLILHVPPISPDMYRLFRAAREDVSGYYRIFLEREKRQRFTDLHVNVDGAAIGALESEFEDAVHGGDVSEARSILAASRVPNSALAGIVNRSFLEKLVSERQGELLVELAYFRKARGAAWGAFAPHLP